MDSVLKIFKAKFPNVDASVETIPQADYDMKVRTAVASGTEVADLLMTEISSRGKMFTLDIYERLEKAPYNLDRNQLFSSVWPLLSNAQGEIISIDCTLCPTGFAYKLDMAKKYLGTSDPAAIEKMLPTWDAFIKVGKDVLSKSGGKVFMLPGKDEVYWVLKAQSPQPFVSGTTVDLKVVQTFFQNAIKMRDSGIIDTFLMNDPSWSSAWGDQNHMFLEVPTWGVKYWLNANDKNASGKYGMIKPPGGAFSIGGAAGSIYKGSKNKTAAWEYLKLWLLSNDGAKALKEGIGYYVAYKKAYDDPTFISWKDPSFPNLDLGDFYFKKVVPTMKLAPISAYDGSVGAALGTVNTNLFSDSKINLNAALDAFKKEISTSEPDLKLK
jgi:multiple sugar transport system substrate-binding protein